MMPGINDAPCDDLSDIRIDPSTMRYAMPPKLQRERSANRERRVIHQNNFKARSGTHSSEWCSLN
jgi:hypothetical protein